MLCATQSVKVVGCMQLCLCRHLSEGCSLSESLEEVLLSAVILDCTVALYWYVLV